MSKSQSRRLERRRQDKRDRTFYKKVGRKNSTNSLSSRTIRVVLATLIAISAGIFLLVATTSDKSNAGPKPAPTPVKIGEYKIPNSGVDVQLK